MFKRFFIAVFFELLLFYPLHAQLISDVACSNKSQMDFLRNYASGKISSSASDYDVHHYKLDLHLERNTLFIEGNVTISATTTSSVLDTFAFELHGNHTIDSVYINGSKKSYLRKNGIVQCPLGLSLNQGSNIRATVYYKGNAPTGGSAAIGQGYSIATSPSWGNEVAWSLSQPYSAYEWFPVKQDLQDKIDSVDVWIKTSSENKVGSNGMLMAVVSLPNNMVQYQWKSTYPIDYYLISVSVAKYVDYTIYAHPTGLADSIKIVNYIYDNPLTLPNFKTEIDKTASMIEVFSEKFGLYPFYKEKYGHCMAPFSGGMEHQTMTTQGFFTTDLTSHELAHQWFGDDVTCSSWKDIFLNEGFASYLEYVYIQASNPADGPAWLDATNNSALQPTGSVYVDDTSNVSRIFSSSLTYNKGAFLLHMLRHEINNDVLFYNALKTYRLKYSGSTANVSQFKSSVELSTGLDLNDFFDQWYFGEGYPIFDIKYNSSNGKVFLKISESVTSPSVTPFFKTHLDIKLQFSDRSDTIVRIFVDQSPELITIPGISANLTNVVVDPDQWVLNDLSGVEKDPGLGIDMINEAGDIKIYPNPVSEEVNINFGQEVQNVQVRVYNLSGSLVYRHKITNTSFFKFNLNEESGTYILKLEFGKGDEKEYKLVKD